jgi:Uma2 family endonuclease
MTTKVALTLEEFLALPETEPASEYIDGEVVQKVAPSWYHASLVHELGRLIGNYVVEHPAEGRVVTELRHVARVRSRAYTCRISACCEYAQRSA